MGSAISGKYNVDLEPPIGDARRSDDAPMASTALKTPVGTSAMESASGGEGDATQQRGDGEDESPPEPEQQQQQQIDGNESQGPRQSVTIGEPSSIEVLRTTKGRFTIKIGAFFKKRGRKKAPLDEYNKGVPAPGYGKLLPSVGLRPLDPPPETDADGEGDNADVESLTDLLGPPERHDEIPDFDAITGKLTFKKAWRGQSASAAVVDAGESVLSNVTGLLTN